MGSQTLEILRQGVWASLTGGWFYDPHQDVFCNTFHLYIWLFLLCFPLTVYIYLPPSAYIWYVYCGLVSVVILVVKIVNYALHYMYDTSECIQEEVCDDWPDSERRRTVLQREKKNRREDEGIELQVLSGKRISGSPPLADSLASYPSEAGAVGGTDADSIDSADFQRHADDTKPTSTIDLKADVHRKNSSESSEELSIHPPSIVTSIVKSSASPFRLTEMFEGENEHYFRPTDPTKREHKRQKSSTDGFVSISITDESNKVPTFQSSFRKLSRQPSTDSQASSLVIEHRPSLQSVNEGSTNNYSIMTSGRRHSNVTNGSLGYIPSLSPTSNIKPTGSLELGYIDKNPNQTLTIEHYNYFKNNRNGVRRIRSTALETCCPAPSCLNVHPNSVEIICGNHKNPVLPPPSTSLIRNQHFSLCPHFSYGSEIVYPIAEQSDEHQTSHGPDTDLDSIQHNSDSDYENNTGSRSPLLYRIDNAECVKILPSSEKDLRKVCRLKENQDNFKNTGMTCR